MKSSSGLHILFFSHYFPPEGNAPASRTYANCKRWVKMGHQVTVITCAPNVPDGKVYDGYKNRLRQTEMIDGIRVIRVWTHIAPNKGTLRRIVNYISYMFSAVFFSLFLKKPDVLIATSPQFFCGWAGLIASTLRRIPFILEIRDIWPESIATVGAIRNRHILHVLERLEVVMYARSPRIITVGEGYRQRLIEKGVLPEKISIIMNGVDRDLFFPREPDEQLRDNLGLNGHFVCGYVGTIGMACGLEIVLQAAALLKQRGREDIAFLLVGDGATRQNLETQVARLGLDNIVFTGRQDKNRIPEFLSISDACLVHLKNSDLFTTVMPSKIFEAAGMARPIIIGVRGFATQLVETANAGIPIEPENASALVAALECLAGNPDLCRRLGRSGYEYLSRRFDRDRLAEDYLDLINRCSSATAVAKKQLSKVTDFTK